MLKTSRQDRKENEMKTIFAYLGVLSVAGVLMFIFGWLLAELNENEEEQ